MWLSWKRARLTGTKPWVQSLALNKLAVVALTGKCRAFGRQRQGVRSSRSLSHRPVCTTGNPVFRKKLINKNKKKRERETSQISPRLAQTTFLIKFLWVSGGPELSQSGCPNALWVKLQTSIPAGKDPTPTRPAAGQAALL